MNKIKEYIKESTKRFVPAMFMLTVGICIGIAVSKSEKPKGKAKQYPIEVLTRWYSHQLTGGSTIECDSVIGDTIWKDGIELISKNIIEVKFK